MQILNDMCKDLLPTHWQNNSTLLQVLYNECQIKYIHKMGGQGTFAQEDPRTSQSTKILLQLVSDEEHIQWGDYGICHFFIEQDALENRQFDQTTYIWDCY